MGLPGLADEAFDKRKHDGLSVQGQEPGDELCGNAAHVQITSENCLHCSVLHINDCSKVLNGSPTILMHNLPNCFHIFGR
jgi:hypothetical protein